MVGMDFKRGKNSSTLRYALIYLALVIFAILLSYLEIVVILFNEKNQIFGQIATIIKILNIFILLYMIFLILSLVRKKNYVLLIWSIFVIASTFYLNYKMIW